MIAGVGPLPFDLRVKMHPFCFKWQSFCWSILKAHSILMFLNEHIMTIIMTPILMFLIGYLIMFAIKCRKQYIESKLIKETQSINQHLEQMRIIAQELEEIARYRDMYGGNNLDLSQQAEPVQMETEQGRWAGGAASPPPSLPPTPTPRPQQPAQPQIQPQPQQRQPQPEKSLPKTVQQKKRATNSKSKVKGGTSNGTSGGAGKKPEGRSNRTNH
ncbi:uncharacterized protein LOC111519851 isoform X1 [Drosophila willistoni]|uniref:uncharacterized protein LOC111519851 isoform X1 n=1 Tax=Drosophila willistoni TaxID=7260 RepID=UPI00017D7F46|nr:uncharacterized protein LOC111519851 isoform X1 [Drosophila willistoni]